MVGATDGLSQSLSSFEQADKADPAESSGRALIAAVSQSDLEKAKSLLESLADPNTIDNHGETPLFEAAATSNINMVAILLQWGADAQTRSRDGTVPRELTANRTVQTLFDLFEGLEVRPQDKDLLMEELSPVVSKEVEELLDSSGEPVSSKQPEETQPAEEEPVGVSSFYADEEPAPKSKEEPVTVSSLYADEEPAPASNAVNGNTARPTPEELLANANKTEKELLEEQKQVFEVIKAKRCDVYPRPDLSSGIRTCKSRGARVHGMELTMDLWLDVGGWMLMDMRGIKGHAEVLRPVDGSLHLVVRSYHAQGICCLEVCCSEVAVRKTPCEQGQLLSTRAEGEFIFARSQSLNGWLRLVGNEGWVYGYGPADMQTVCVMNHPDVDDMDLWMVSDLWAAVRKENDGVLSEDKVEALKMLQEESLQLTYTRLGRCKPGGLEEYLALGLTPDEMKQSRWRIIRRLFVIIMVEQLQTRGILKHMSNLVFCEPPPEVRGIVATLELAAKDGEKIYDLGPDSTVYDPETGSVFGLWHSDTEQILSTTHISLFCIDHPLVVSQANGQRDSGGMEGPPSPACSDTQEPDAFDAGGEGAGQHGAICTFESSFEQGVHLLKSNCFLEAVPYLNQALVNCESDTEVDLGLERQILKARAKCWEGLEDFERLLVDTDRLLAMDNDLEGPWRHFFHTGNLRDPEVQQLRERAFSARFSDRGFTRRPCDRAYLHHQRRHQTSLADID